MIGSGMQENADIILKYSGGIVSSIMVIGFANRIKDIPADFTVADVYGKKVLYPRKKYEGNILFVNLFKIRSITPK